MRPDSEAALAACIRDTREPLSITGGATRLCPGEGLGTRLDVSGLSGIIRYEPEALTLVVRAGTPLETVQQTLAADGQMLGFEPSGLPGSTIGGVIAANAPSSASECCRGEAASRSGWRASGTSAPPMRPT